MTEIVAIQKRDFSSEEIETIKSVVLKGKGIPEEVQLFLFHCKRTGLCPFARQIYATFKWDAQLGRETLASIAATIDGFRVVAERSGKYAGQTGPFWCGEDGVWKDVWLGTKEPVAAKVGVLRKGFDAPIEAVALMKSYKQLGKQGQAIGFWGKGSEHMLSKCAEALALRKAFPNDLSGIYTEDELAEEKDKQRMEQAKTIDVEAFNTPAIELFIGTREQKQTFAQIVRRLGVKRESLESLAIAMKDTPMQDLEAEVTKYVEAANGGKKPDVVDIYGPNGTWTAD